MSLAVAPDARWQLYRLLSDPVRLRLLALANETELAIGELAELLDQPQPNVSRHAGALRHAGLLLDRRDGTRIFVRVAGPAAAKDLVVSDALAEGRRLTEADGSLARVPEIVRRRDARTREFFASEAPAPDPDSGDLSAYLCALGALLPKGGLGVDAGTGDGTALEMLAALFERVVAVDRSEKRLEGARHRAAVREYGNVEFVCGEVDGAELRRAVGAGADVVVAGRMLHHAPEPVRTLRALGALLAPGGRLLVVDYASHEDEAFRESEADVWMGFEPAQLTVFAEEAGLADARVLPIPRGCWTGERFARSERIPWLALVARKPDTKSTRVLLPGESRETRGTNGKRNDSRD
jgi:ArsR family transcriptional regulator